MAQDLIAGELRGPAGIADIAGHEQYPDMRIARRDDAHEFRPCHPRHHDVRYHEPYIGPLREQRASGKGRVYTTSLVCRAATPETRAHVPYNILLVDCAEGFRMMAHGENDLAIGDTVTVSFQPFAGKLLPFFTKET